MEGRMERNQVLGTLSTRSNLTWIPPCHWTFLLFEPTDFLYCLSQFNLGFLWLAAQSITTPNWYYCFIAYNFFNTLTMSIPHVVQHCAASFKTIVWFSVLWRYHHLFNSFPEETCLGCVSSFSPLWTVGFFFLIHKEIYCKKKKKAYTTVEAGKACLKSVGHAGCLETPRQEGMLQSTCGIFSSSGKHQFCLIFHKSTPRNAKARRYRESSAQQLLRRSSDGCCPCLGC